MKLKLSLLILILLTLTCSLPVNAQQKATLTAASTDCSTAASCLSVTIDNVTTNAGAATFTISANASGNTIQFEASGDGGTTWVSLNVYPSTGTQTAVTSSTTTSPSTWQANTAGFSNVRMRMSTLSGTTTNVAIKLSTASASSGRGGGGGSGTISGLTAGQVGIAGAATTITSSKALQGTDTNILTSGTVSGTAASLCTDANGGATTTGCSTGGITNQAAKAIPTNTSGTASLLDSVVCTPPATVGTFVVEYQNPTAAATAPGCPQAGVATRSDVATSASPVLSTDTAATDIVYAAATAAAVTVPTPTTLANANPIFATDNNLTAGAVTFTPTTFTVNGGATLVMQQKQRCVWEVNPASATDWFVPCVDRAGYMNGLIIPTSATGLATNSSGQAVQQTSANILAICTTCVTSAAALTSTQIMTGAGSQGAQTPSSAATLDSSGNGAFLSLKTGTTPCTNLTVGTGGIWCGNEGTTPTGTLTGYDTWWADSTGHCAHGNFNNTDVGCAIATLSPSPALGKSGTAGTLAMYPASGNFTTTWGSAATASNTILGFATVPTTTDIITCVVASTTCTLTDSGIAVASNKIAISVVGTAGLSGTAPATISAAGAIGCATCTTNASALTANVIVKGGGSQATQTSSITDDAKNITTAEVVAAGNKVFVTTDYTDSSSGSLQIITGLTWTLPTSKAVNYSFHCELMFDQATAAVVDEFGVGVTGTAPTNLSADGRVFSGTSGAWTASGVLTGLASTTPTLVVSFTPSAITTVWTASLDGTVEQPSNATPGVFSIYAYTTTGTDNLIVKRGSYCSLF